MDDSIKYTVSKVGENVYFEDDGQYVGSMPRMLWHLIQAEKKLKDRQIAELEAELSRKCMSLADTEALLMGTEERLKKKEAELELERKTVQVLARDI